MRSTAPGTLWHVRALALACVPPSLITDNCHRALWRPGTCCANMLSYGRLVAANRERKRKMLIKWIQALCCLKSPTVTNHKKPITASSLPSTLFCTRNSSIKQSYLIYSLWSLPHCSVRHGALFIARKLLFTVREANVFEVNLVVFSQKTTIRYYHRTFASIHGTLSVLGICAHEFNKRQAHICLPKTTRFLWSNELE